VRYDGGHKRDAFLADQASLNPHPNALTLLNHA